uniref:Minor tail protein n=1 Tax=Gordonia phage Petito TaxID=3158876 RepID=A0AAU8GQ69_9CAUD
MDLNKIAEQAQEFFVQNRGRMGFSYGLLAGASIMYWHLRSTKSETELIVTDEDAAKMLDEDVIAVYQTKHGPIFMAMQKEMMEKPDVGSS